MPTEGRRAHERLDFDTDVVLSMGERTVQASCRNISQGGMFIATEEQFDMNASVRVKFTLPDMRGKEIDAQATVRWLERDATGQVGVGVQFDGLRAIEVWAINQLFRRESKES